MKNRTRRKNTPPIFTERSFVVSSILYMIWE
jgi:hypothetical protein